MHVERKLDRGSSYQSAAARRSCGSVRESWELTYRANPAIAPRE
jgi:hypothetical protein